MSTKLFSGAICKCGHAENMHGVENNVLGTGRVCCWSEMTACPCRKWMPQPTTCVGGIYRHRKGGLYTVVSRALNEADLVPVVVYCSHEDAGWWVRPEADFHAVVDGKPRFALLSELEA